jgi:hypothetical protein
LIYYNFRENLKNIITKFLNKLKKKLNSNKKYLKFKRSQVPLRRQELGGRRDREASRLRARLRLGPARGGDQPRVGHEQRKTINN